MGHDIINSKPKEILDFSSKTGMMWRANILMEKKRNKLILLDYSISQQSS